MSERYLNEALGRLPQAPVEIVVETLSTVWVRVLYAPQAARSRPREVLRPKSIAGTIPRGIVSPA